MSKIVTRHYSCYPNLFVETENESNIPTVGLKLVDLPFRGNCVQSVLTEESLSSWQALCQLFFHSSLHIAFPHFLHRSSNKTGYFSVSLCLRQELALISSRHIQLSNSVYHSLEKRTLSCLCV